MSICKIIFSKKCNFIKYPKGGFKLQLGGFLKNIRNYLPPTAIRDRGIADGILAVGVMAKTRNKELKFIITVASRYRGGSVIN